MEFKISKELLSSNDLQDMKSGEGEIGGNQAPTVLKIAIQRDPSKLAFAKALLTLIGLINTAIVIVSVLILSTGLDFVHLFNHREVKLAEEYFSEEHITIM